ncbi:HK97 family phage prohead protease [Gordonia sp. WA4-43]|uniref:HK97 family phage prohead protease n=1 Tax=Gordonia sp. WA4-43 TaxID=2878678 RepID=UPI001CFA6BDA|nr:HK97 family phage prohead protease [Gordonia sp. WA4-43]UCZ89059.1 HK97 family phage prohead protease [Gordonia sp. WA4-43]
MKKRTAGPGQINVKTRFKAGPDAGLAEGEFFAYASVFGNVDSYGEVVQKGAFADSLADWAKGDNPIPLLWGHNFADPDYNLGYVKEAVEDDRGLKVHAVLDMESPKSAQVYRLLKSGRVAQMSFAFDVERETYVEAEAVDNGDGTKTVTPGYWSLEQLKIHEVSVVPLGANQETEVLAVKSAADSLRAKAGKVLSAKNEGVIRDSIERLETTLDELKSILPADDPDDEGSDGDGEEDQDQTSGKGTAPGDAKSAGQATPDRPSVSLATLDALDLEIAVSA